MSTEDAKLEPGTQYEVWSPFDAPMAVESLKKLLEQENEEVRTRGTYMCVSELIRENREQILSIAKSHGATSVRIFGSVARQQARPESDLDLLVQLEPGYSLLDLIAIKQDLEDLLGCPVDVVTEPALSPYIREQVLHDATTL